MNVNVWDVTDPIQALIRSRLAPHRDAARATQALSTRRLSLVN